MNAVSAYVYSTVYCHGCHGRLQQPVGNGCEYSVAFSLSSACTDCNWLAVPTASCRNNMQHATCNRHHAACNRHHATCNLQQTSCNLQDATNSMQHATYNRHHATCNSACRPACLRALMQLRCAVYVACCPRWPTSPECMLGVASESGCPRTAGPFLGGGR